MAFVPLVTVTSADQLRRAYRDVLAPTFPPSELGPESMIVSGWESGRSRAWIATEDESVLGVAMRDELIGTRTALLTYLALAPGRRGGGIGSALYEQVVAAAAEDSAVDLLLGEFEHPAVHAGSDAGGDPLARLRFYERHGATGLALPYFQPGIAGSPRVPGFILGALAVAEGVRRPGGVDAAPLRQFLDANLRGNEGVVADDPATAALLRAAAGDVVATVSLSEPDRIPHCDRA